MRRSQWVWGLLAALLLTSAAVKAAETLRIVPIVGDEQVMLSFELADAYTADVRDAISSGLRATFTYDIDLRMDVPVWVDRTVVTAVVSTSDQYDNLTRRHHLTRMVDGRVVEETMTEDESVVKRWLTTVTRLPLCGTTRLEANSDYYVRIRARMRPTHASILGWGDATTAQARFTFVR
jgi:hypothetical protein